MKRIFLPVALCFGVHTISAQVGINKEVPKATLDVVSNRTDGTKPEGVLIPRLTADQVKTMTEANNVVGEDQNSMLVYIAEVSSSFSKTGKFEYIDTPGYYYYAHDTNTPANSRWKKVLETANEPTGLERVFEGGKMGWRYIGATPSSYNGIGNFATDMAHNPTTEEELDRTVTTNFGSISTQTYRKYKAFLQMGSQIIDFQNLGAIGDHSFSAGLWNRAKGASSVALGTAVVADGDYSFAFGLNSKTEGVYSIAMGIDTYARGLESYAIGTKVDIDSYSLGFGRKVKVKGGLNMALGDDLLINGGEYCFVFGTGNVVGNKNEENPQGSISKALLIGDNNTALANNAAAFGSNLTVESKHSTALGVYNTEEDTPEKDSFEDKTKRLLVVGNGNNKNTKSDAFTILRDARVGVGISNFEKSYDEAQGNGIGHIDEAKLQVNGLIQSRGILTVDGATANKVVVADDKGVFKTVERSAVGSNIYTANGVIPEGTTRTVTFSDDASNITFTRGTANSSPLLVAMGSMKATAFNLNSDARLKTNIANLSSDKIDKLRAVSYVWNAEGKKQGGDDKLQYGFIAQEVEKVYPHLVTTDEKGYKSVNYTQVIPVLTKAVQEDRVTIEELKKSLDSQNQRIQELEQAVQALLNK